jgi:hypothetical protein
MPKTKELEPVEVIPNGTAEGYRPKPSTRRVIADPSLYDNPQPLFKKALDHLTPDTVSFFEAEIGDSLTIAQQKRMTLNCSWPEVFAQIAPFVYSWNAHAQNADTGEWEQLPPPAEAGPDVFDELPMHHTNTGWIHPVAAFLWLCIAANHGGDLPKGRSTTESTENG